MFRNGFLLFGLSALTGCTTTAPSPNPLARSVNPEPAFVSSKQEVIVASASDEPKQAEKKDRGPEIKPAIEQLTAPHSAPAIQGTTVDSSRTPLALEEVLDSVERHYPMLQAAEEERAIAGGRLLTAMGAFDTNARFSSNNMPLGTYENYRFLTGVEQAFAGSGATLFATYRGGYGDFPIYYGERKTADGGEFRAGATVPLLRDRAIDRRRANLQQARIGVEAADPIIDRTRLDIYRSAARVYWVWVTAGERLRLAQKLVDLAVERDKQLQALEKNKLVAPIDRVDNQQNVAARNAILIESQLRFQQASVDLSLFHRDANGQPLLPAPERLPRFPELTRPSEKDFAATLENAYQNRPELKRLRLQREALEVERRLAENQLLPALNSYLVGSQDIGQGKPSSGPSRLDRSSLEAGVEFQVPIQRRDAMGRVAAARAQIRQLFQQEQLARDTIRAEVQSAFANLERAYELRRQAQQRVTLARQVAEAERQRLSAGDSDVLRVTLREQAVFDAEMIEIGAVAEYFRATADFQAATGAGR